MLLKTLLLLFPFWSSYAGPELPLPYSKSIKREIKKGAIFSNSEVEDVGATRQKMVFSIAGLHRRACSMVLPAMSQYEDYADKIGFIEKSAYRKGRVYFLLNSPILPFKIVLDFILPRLTSTGDYSFYFDRGFLRG